VVTAGPVARREELRGHLAMLAFSALVAGSFSLGGRIANDIDPVALTAVRFVLAAGLLGAAALATGRLPATTFSAPWRYAVTGGLFAFYFVCMFQGLKTAAPVPMAAVFTLTPLMAAGFGWWIMAQRTTAGMAAALGLGGAGALWVIFRGDLAALLALEVGRGEAIYLAGCAAHALYIPMVQKLGRGEGVFAFGFGTLLVGAVLLLLAGLPKIVATDWMTLPLRVWGGLAYLAVFASFLSISLLQFASMRLKAAKVMAYTFLTPSFVILWELALSGTLPTALILPGIALTMAALLILLKEGRATSPFPPSGA
jgi:drug/metabolite transporter (DMT)-like permease